MFEIRVLPGRFREDTVPEFLAWVIALCVVAIFYGVIGALVRHWFEVPYLSMFDVTTAAVRFAENSLLGLLTALALGCVLAAYLVAQFVLFLLVDDSTS